ncbi:MAG TPA: hybrid sensor histidine kinase/response regulator [Burkholderiaceae bacterium]|jgi:signal transduction histidine kinase/ActR/RegA family two-component response regulator
MSNEASTPTRGIREELLLLLARQGARAAYPVGLVALVLACMAAQHLAWPWVVGWCVLVAAALTVRWAVLKRLPGLDSQPLPRRLRWAISVNALNGVVLALSLGFVPWLDEPQRMVQAMLLLAVCAGAVSTTMGHTALLAAFIGPVLLAEALGWLVLGPGRSSWLEWGMAGLLMVYGLILLDLARDNYRSLIQALQARVHQARGNQQLRTALQQAEQAMQAKTRFLAAASHDLRQPMHTLSLYGAALMRRPLDQLSAEIGRNLNLALQVLAAQMDALLDISKLDAQQVPVRQQLFNLAPWLQRLTRELMPAAHLKGLVLALDCPPQCSVETDPVLLDRVVRNLLDNAIKYTERGHVQVTVTRDGGLWRMAVRDTGIGIAGAEQARVFEEFYQVGNHERDRGHGLGLGLSIVTRLVDLLDLSLALESAPGVGSCFSLGLAVAEGHAGESGGEPAAQADLTGLRVLVLDNEEQVRRAMQTLLETHGCEVAGAGDTREALLQSLRRPPDLVLCDLRLRGKEDGLAAIRALRGMLPGLQALLISGDTSAECVREAEAAGLRLLHKPVLEATLLEALQETLIRVTARSE